MHCWEWREVTLSLPAKRERALGKTRFFRGKHFFFTTTVSYQLLTRAPRYFELTRVFRFSDGFSPQNLRWSHRVSRLRLLLWKLICRILLNMRRGSWRNMARLYWWLYNHNPHRHFWKCSYPDVTGLFSDDDLRSINDKTISLNLK